MDQTLNDTEQELASRRLTVRKDLKKLAQLAAKFRAGFDEICDEARAEIRLRSSWSRYESVCLFVDDIIAASVDLPRPKAAAGRPLSCTPACEQFVALLYAGQCDGHWCVSVDPDSGTGTLAKFLKLAKPYLPDGFSDGSGSGLKHFQRMGTELNKHASAEPGWFSKMVATIEAAYKIKPGT